MYSIFLFSFIRKEGKKENTVKQKERGQRYKNEKLKIENEVLKEMMSKMIHDREYGILQQRGFQTQVHRNQERPRGARFERGRGHFRGRNFDRFRNERPSSREYFDRFRGRDYDEFERRSYDFSGMRRYDGRKDRNDHRGRRFGNKYY